MDTSGTGEKYPIIIEVSVLEIEINFICILLSQGPSNLSVIERCPYYIEVSILEK